MARLHEQPAFLEVRDEVSAVIWVCDKAVPMRLYKKKRKTKKRSTGKQDCVSPPFFVPLGCIHSGSTPSTIRSPPAGISEADLGHYDDSCPVWRPCHALQPVYLQGNFCGSLALCPFPLCSFSSKNMLEVILKGTGQNTACLITDFMKTG